MFGFPPILDGNAGIKFTNNADSGFPKPGIREIFYSVRDGDWLNPNVWQTASGRVGLSPTANDDVYVRHSISLPTTTPTYNVNNLFINAGGVLIYPNTTPVTVNVFGNIQCLGTLFLNNAAHQLFLYGVNNRIDNITNNFLTIFYVSSQTQPILNTPNLQISLSNGIKTINQDLICRTFSISGNASLELGGYNMTVNGIATIQGRLTKSTYGNILIVGSLSIGNTLMDLSAGNPDVELRGGITVGGNMTNFKSGAGIWTLNTNSQGISQSGIVSTTIFDCQILIKSGVTFTINMSNAQSITLNNIINGEDGTSRLVNNNSTLNFATAASVPSMTTGIWDFTTNANTIGYTGNYSATIPSYFTTFRNLTISGTGTKTTSANTTVNGALTLQSSGNLTLGGDLVVGAIDMINNASATLQCSSYNLTVNGTTTIRTNVISKNSNVGTITFNGAVSMGNGDGFNFSGNPNVEFKNGLDCTNNSTANTNTGTGQWKFSTVSQLFTMAGTCFSTFNASILISGAITLTMRQTYAPATMNISNTIDGDNAGSTLTLALSSLTLRFTNISNYIPMSTFGIFNRLGGIVDYGFNGSITLPYTSYGGLRISGTGTKTLLGNTTIAGDLHFQNNVVMTFECSTFNLTVNGQTSINDGTNFRKSGAGNLTFIGLFRAATSLSNPTFINFSGNPNVEFRGGILAVNIGSSFTTGTGTFTFTTASQSLNWNAAVTFNCNILISGNITISQVADAGFVNNTIFNGTLNGDSAGSTYRIGASTTTPFTATYNNTTQPMATGVLDTSTNLNTFIYGAGNQDVKGGTPQQYRNLRFSGSGTTKTLQGNINVQNTYTVDAGVTVNLNGFSKTP